MPTCRALMRRAMLKNARLVSTSFLEPTPRNCIAELDPLCRAVLVLRVAIRSSIQDCALRLNVSRAAVLAANCHAMTWLHDRHVKPVEDNHDAFARCVETRATAELDVPVRSSWSGSTIGLERV